MGLLDKLKALLELEDEDAQAARDSAPRTDVVHLDPPPASFTASPLRHISPEESAADAEIDRNPDGADDVMVPPPPEKYKAAYVDQAGGLQNARDLDSARVLAEASQMLKERQGVAKGAGRFLRPASGAARPPGLVEKGPPGEGETDSGKADLLSAIDRVAKPPDEEGPPPMPAPEPQRASAGPPPPTPPPEAGGPLGSLQKMLMGSTDPRTERLRAALEERAKMKRTASRVRGMGIGADLALGTNVHRGQGDDLDKRADDMVRDATMPTEFEQKNQRFDQDMRLRETAEGRAQSAEQRAGNADLRAGSADRRAEADELRKGESFKTQQGYTDAASQTSANARASVEALYPTAWKKIPEDIRSRFSAKDVERIFGELKPQDFAPKGAGGGGVNGRFDARMAATAKLPNAGKILDLNDVLATLEAGKAPGTGYIMNKDGWQNFLRTPDGVAFKQKTQAIINKHIKDTTGLVVRESEEGRIMGELGYGSWDDANALDSGLHKMAEESQADLDQVLNKLPPGAKKLLESQGAVPKIGAKHGKVIKGSRRNFGDEDTFNPRELLRRALGRGSRDRTLGYDPESADEEAAAAAADEKARREEDARRGFRF